MGPLRNTTMRVNVEVNSNQLTAADRQINESVNTARNLERQANASGREIEQTGRRYSEASDSVRRNTNSLRDNASQSHSASSRQRELSDSARRTGDGFRRQSSEARRASDSLSTLQSHTEKSIKSYMELGKSLVKIATLPGLGASAVKVGMEFDKQMSGVQAISSATADQFKALRGEAISLGAQTTKSSSEVAAGMTDLAKAGFSVKQIMGAMPGVINASSASGADMSQTASIMSDALNGFGLSATKASHISDVLAMSANKTNADISDMGYTFKYAAPVAHALGDSLEDVSAATGLMANAGIRGEQAGTTLRSVMLSLTNPTKNAKAELADLSVKINDAHGNMLPFGTIVHELSDGMEGMTKTQKASAIATIFGKEAASGMLAIIAAGPAKYDALTKSLKESDGASAKAAHTMQNNFSGAVEQLGGTIESIAINVSDVLTPAVRTVTNWLADMGNKFNDLSPSGKKFVVELAGVAAAIGPIVFAYKILNKGFSRFTNFLSGSDDSFRGYRHELGRTSASALEMSNQIQRAMARSGESALRMAEQVREANAIISSSTPNVSSSRSSSTSSYSDLMREGHNRRVRGSSGSSRPNASSTVNNAEEIVNDVAHTAEEVGSEVSHNRSLSRIGRMTSSVGRVAGKGLRAIPFLGTALSATQLIGMNSSNAAEKLTSFGGSAAGATIGGAIGTAILPGIGTAIGGALGGYAGDAFGKKFGKKLQTNFTSILPSVEDFGKGVSKSTSKAVNDYKSLNDKATVQLEYLASSGDKLSKDASKSLSKNFDDMAQQVEDRLSKSAKSTKTNLQKLVSSSVLNTSDMKDILVTHNRVLASEKSQIEKTNKAIQTANTNMYKDSNKVTVKYEKQINDIKSTAKKKGLALTIDEIKKIKSLEQQATEERRNIQSKYKNQIEKLQSQQNKNAVTSLSRSAKEQKLILGKLKEDSGIISARQAADVVKQSVKARNGAVKEANKKYKGVMDAANEEYFVNGSISKKQYEDIKANATKQRDAAVSLAKDMNEKVVDQAKKQAAGHLKEVDWETGKTLSTWNQTEITLSKVINGITGGINKVLGFLHLPTIPEWHPAGTTGANINYSSAKSKVVANGASISTYASGTNYHPGGKSLVGEEGPELAYVPYKGATLVGQGGAEVVDLPRGAKVLPYHQTRQVLNGGFKGSMPGYASGTLGAIQDFTSWLMHPIQQTEKLFNGFLPFKNDIGPGKGLGNGILSYAKSGVGNYLKNALNDITGIGGKASGSKQVQAWLLEAIGATGISPSYLGALSQIAMHESGGNPKSVNLWDSNAKAGHPSKGLMQTIDSTFNAYALNGHNDIWNPVDNAIASIRYSIAHYGSIDNVPGIKSLSKGGKYRGYKNGGRKFGNDQVLVGENGPELVNLPDGSNIYNSNKTHDLLNGKHGSVTIKFAPKIEIKINSSNNDTTEARIQRAVNQALEEAFKNFRGLFDTGVVI